MLTFPLDLPFIEQSVHDKNTNIFKNSVKIFPSSSVNCMQMASSLWLGLNSFNIDSSSSTDHKSIFHNNFTLCDFKNEHLSPL